MPALGDIKFSQFLAGGNVQVGDIVVGLRAATNYQFTFPGTGINDSNGNPMFSYASAGVGAVNDLTLTNSTTGNPVSLTATGTDANISILIDPKGSGNLILDTLTWPLTDGSSGQVLSTNGAGVLSFITPTAGTVTSVSGTANRITSTGGSTPVIDISAAYVGQTSVTTLGTVTTGTWDATPVGVIYGGTGLSSISQYSFLYASAANTIAAFATQNRSVLTTTSAGVPTWIALNDGQLVIGSSAGSPAAATITGSSTVTVTNAGNSITLTSATGASGLVWSIIAGTTQAGAANHGYIIGNSSQTTITLPATVTAGQAVAIQGSGAGVGGWVVVANSGQTIHIGAAASSVAGSVTSANQYDSLYLVCTSSNTEWTMFSCVSSGVTIA